MFPMDIDYLVRKQQQQDLLRKMEYRHLVRMAESGRTVKWQTPRLILAWIGHRMIKWGVRLQNFGPPSPTNGSTTVKYV